MNSNRNSNLNGAPTRRRRRRRGNVNVSRRNPNNVNANRNRNLELQTYLTNGPRVPQLLQRSTPFPVSMTKICRYVDPSYVLQGASPFLIREFSMNSAFDPDPALGGGTPAGFNQMATIYDQYHVEKFRIRFNICSNETGINGLTFGLIFRDVQPSTAITTYANAINSLEVAPTTGPKMISRASGMDRWMSPEYKIDPGTVIGNYSQYMGDSKYSSVTTASPTQQCWVALIVIAPTSATNLSNGVITNFNLQYTTRFYSINAQLGLSQVKVRDQEPCIADPMRVVVVSNSTARSVPENKVDDLESDLLSLCLQIDGLRVQDKPDYNKISKLEDERNSLVRFIRLKRESSPDIPEGKQDKET